MRRAGRAQASGRRSGETLFPERRPGFQGVEHEFAGCKSLLAVQTGSHHQSDVVIWQQRADAGNDQCRCQLPVRFRSCRDSAPASVLRCCRLREVARAISCSEVGTSTIQPFALGGVANATFIFCMPVSTVACGTGREKVISHPLDCRTRPCNLVELMPRVLE